MNEILNRLENGVAGLAVAAIGALLLASAFSPVPLAYNLRNAVVRWRSTLATVAGLGLVVAVYVVLKALAQGIEASGAATGDPANILITRQGAQSESSSLVTREHLRTLAYLPEIARGPDGRPLVSADILVLVNLPRKDGQGEANVLLRGVSGSGRELRPQVELVAGRWFVPGRREVVVSRRLAGRFEGFGIGDSFQAGPGRLTVVGWLDGGRSAFDSECWLDADECRALFDRDQYSSFLVRPVDGAAAAALERRVEGDRRLQLRAERETDYYAAQTMTAVPIKLLGNLLAAAMSVGAMFAAMNTMYASVGSRTREIGTLRVLGFRRRTVLLGFLVEGAVLATAGGVLGCLLALPIHGMATATISFETFSESVFEFTITPWMAAKGIIFSVAVGLLGTLLPAIRASRLPVINALKSL